MNRIVRVGSNAKTLAVVEQVLFSSVGFAQTIFLSRESGLGTVGLFTTVYVLFLLLSGVFNAFVIEPLPFSLRQEESLHEAYRWTVAKYGLTLSAVLGLALLVLGSLYFMSTNSWTSNARTTVALLSLAGSLTLLFWLARRLLYFVGRIQAALTLSALYALTFFVILVGLFVGAGQAPLLSVLLALIFSSLVPVLFYALRWPLHSKAADGATSSLLRRTAWMYGKAALGTSLLAWVVQHGVVIVLDTLSSKDQVGLYRVYMLLILPLTNVGGALALSRVNQLIQEDVGAHRQFVSTWSRNFLLGSAAFALMLVIARPIIESLLKTTLEPGVILLVCTLASFTLVFNIAATSTRVRGQPNIELCATIWGSVALVVLLALLPVVPLPTYVYVLVAQSLSIAVSVLVWSRKAWNLV